jgi:AcrR family transcriptional regulator
VASKANPTVVLLQPDGEKAERFARVAQAVVTVLLRTGPTGLTYARVARRAGVSRAWLYKYFDKDRDALIEHAIASFGQAFAGVAESPSADLPFRERVLRGTRQGLDDALAAPWVLEVWYRYRHSEHPLGDAVRGVLKTHVAEFAATVPPSVAATARARERFATVFAAARLGVFHQWLDADFRSRHTAEEVVADIARWLPAQGGA